MPGLACVLVHATLWTTLARVGTRDGPFRARVSTRAARVALPAPRRSATFDPRDRSDSVYFPYSRLLVAGLERADEAELGLAGASPVWAPGALGGGAVLGYAGPCAHFAVAPGRPFWVETAAAGPWTPCEPAADALCRVPGGAAVVPEALSPTARSLAEPGVFGVALNRSWAVEYQPGRGVRLLPVYAQEGAALHGAVYMTAATAGVLWYSLGAGLSQAATWRAAPRAAAAGFGAAYLVCLAYLVWSVAADSSTQQTARQLQRLVRSADAPRSAVRTATALSLGAALVTAPAAVHAAAVYARRYPMAAVVSARAAFELAVHTTYVWTLLHGEIGVHTVFAAVGSSGLLLCSRTFGVTEALAHARLGDFPRVSETVPVLAWLAAAYVFVLAGALPLAQWSMPLFPLAHRVALVPSLVLAAVSCGLARAQRARVVARWDPAERRAKPRAARAGRS